MIEVVYTPKDNGKSNDVIRLPKNIKQIGDIKGSRKIYIEDYAINYIEEVHMQEADTEVGVLLGMAQKSGSDRYIFIKGAITVPNVFVSESEIAISENDWSYIYEIAGKYFPCQEIVGWFISIDGVNASILRTMKKTHADHFAGGEKALFVFDRQENSRYFCTYENNQLVRQNGYTIYYERNEEMQDYMVDMRNGKRIEVEVEDDSPRPAFRNIINDEERPVKNTGRKQAFVNYCANVAMVVLILFIGMYIMDGKKQSDKTTEAENNLSTITPVVKVDGDVYPTEMSSQKNSGNIEESTGNVESTGSAESTGGEIVGNSEADTQSTKTDAANSETSGSYITVNNNVNGETTAGTTETTAAKETATEAAKEASGTTYKEHVVAKGDSLLTISRKYYGDSSMVDEIMKLNGIEDMDKIYIGQKIKLP